MKPARILGLIPARSGSVGVKNKNIAPLAGRPLIEHSIIQALESDVFADVVVSTDGREIAAISRKAGAWVPFRRPARLATSQAKSIDVVLHALEFLDRRHRRRYDAVSLIQPTAPLRTAGDLRACVALYRRHRPCSIVSLVALEEPHPYKLKLIYDGKVYPFLPGSDSGVPRQSLPPVYALNGAVYVADVETLRTARTFLHSERTLPYLMPRERSVNIDSTHDLEVAEALFRREAPREE